MAELEWDTNPKRPSLRRAVRHRVRDLERPVRIAAENFLVLESRMDLLGVGIEGELVSLRIGIGKEDATLLTHSLSDLAWLRSHGEDLARLVPDLGIEGAAKPRALLLCPSFRNETRSAIESLPLDSVELVTYRCYRNRGQLGVLLEHRSTARRAEGDDNSPDHDARDGLDAAQLPAVPRPSLPIPAPGAASGFRTGLTDADLRADASDLMDVDDSDPRTKPSSSL
jgi:hypothetical protein